MGRHLFCRGYYCRVAVYQDIIRGCWKQERTLRISLREIIERLDAYDCRPASPDGEALCEQGVHFEKQGNFVQAYTLYQRSAQKGYFKGQSNYANFLLTGQGGGPPDKVQAYQWLLKAAEQGHARAMFNLGRMLEKGDGIAKDEERALNWYQRAVAAGHQEAEQRIERLLQVMRINPIHSARYR